MKRTISDQVRKHGNICISCITKPILPEILYVQEVQDRCIVSMVNEGFKILEEGIVSEPQFIDVIFLFGYAFPRYRGGPMFYASQMGLSRVYERVCFYGKQDRELEIFHE